MLGFNNRKYCFNHCREGDSLDLNQYKGISVCSSSKASYVPIKSSYLEQYY